MEIKPIINYDFRINNTKQKKPAQPPYRYGVNNEIQKPDSFEYTSRPCKNSNPVFTGLLGIGEDDEIQLDGPQKLLSEKQLRKARKKAINEVQGLINGEYSDAKVERLDKLLHSPYVDYSLGCIGDCDFSLNELISGRHRAPNRMYNFFISTVLGETHPDISQIEDYKKLYKENNGIRHSISNYVNLDETSREAQAVRKMVQRLLKNNIDVPIYPQLFADCLMSGKPEMCKVLMNNSNISPFTDVPIVKDNSLHRQDIEEYRGVQGYSKIYEDNAYSSDYPKVYTKPSKFAIVYNEGEKFADYYMSSKIKLYQLSGLSKNPECRNLFDIPDILYNSYQGKTNYKWWDKRNHNPNYFPYSQKLNAFFDPTYSVYHPEIEEIDFKIEVLSKFMNEGGIDLSNDNAEFLHPIAGVDYKLNEKAFERLKELKNETPEDADKKKILEYISALDAASDSDTLDVILRNPNIDPNTSDKSNPPLAFKFLSRAYGYDIVKKREHRYMLQNLLESPNINLHTKYNNKTLTEALNAYLKKLSDKNIDVVYSTSKDVSEIIFNALDLDMVRTTKKIVNKTETLTLKQIGEFLQYPRVDKIINEPLNDLGESIGFFVADTELTLGNMDEFEKIMESLVNNKYDFVFRHNKMGQSCYDKAVEADNAVMVDYMKNYRRNK